MLTSGLWNGGYFQPTGTAERNKGSDQRETALFSAVYLQIVSFENGFQF
nr:hypothetical protein [uncultured Flavobacterium sp.]